MAGDPSNLTLASLALASVGAVLAAHVRSALSVARQLCFGLPFVAGIIAVGEFSGLGQVLGSGALIASFVAGLILYGEVARRRRRVDRETRHAK